MTDTAAFQVPEEGTSLQAFPSAHRGITPKTFAHYGVKLRVDRDGNPTSIVFPVPDGRIQVRSYKDKKFWFEGSKEEGNPLFGSDKFPPGSAQAITITEGYFDALASYQMLDSKYPNVAVYSSVSARAECAKAFEYLNSFEKIYLAFDADQQGQDAADAVARLFDFNKVYLVPLSKERKDANAYLMSSDEKSYYKAWWASKRFLPAGILSSYSEFDQIIDEDVEKPSVAYPFPTLQDLTFGIRSGEMVLLTAQEGIGKTEIIRAIEYHLLKNTTDNIGILHLEENKARTLKGFVGYELRSPVHLPEFSLSKDDLKKHLRAATGRDERLHVYGHFGSDDPDVILSTIRFMAGACGCKYIFLDHITMVVSGLQGDDERRALDYISTRLAMMVEELDFTLFMISHVNDEGKTRGSRNIAKVADLRIDLHRDLTAEDDFLRNTTTLTVSKNRYAGKTGPAGHLYFNPDSYILEETEEAIPS
jgi:twinkle protein